MAIKTGLYSLIEQSVNENRRLHYIYRTKPPHPSFQCLCINLHVNTKKVSFLLNTCNFSQCIHYLFDRLLLQTHSHFAHLELLPIMVALVNVFLLMNMLKIKYAGMFDS